MDADELLWRYRGGERDFTAVNVSGFSLFSQDLIDIILNQADLRKSNLTFAYLNRAQLIKTNLSSCKLSGATLIRADLQLKIFRHL